MDARGIEAKETVPASRKLGREEAAAIVAASTRVIVAKGKKLTEHSTAGAEAETVIQAMLGPTGNLRSPTIRHGRTVLVGFNEEAYQRVLG